MGARGYLAHRLVPLKKHHTTALVTRGKVVSCVIKLYRRDNVGWTSGQQSGAEKEHV